MFAYHIINGGIRQGLGTKPTPKSRLTPPWNILVENQKVNCAKFSNF